MGGGDLNLKKSWHPNTFHNREKVWKAEQAAEEEQKKLEELRKELADERATQDLKQLQEAAGLSKRSDRLDWMYGGGGGGGGGGGVHSTLDSDKESYLLGRKPVDAILHANAPLAEFESSLSSTGKAPQANYGAHANSVRDTFSKLREDPLLAIKRREQETLKAVLSNPLKLRQLQLARGIHEDPTKASSKDPKKKLKKHKKSRDSRRSSRRSRSRGNTARRRSTSRSSDTTSASGSDERRPRAHTKIMDAKRSHRASPSRSPRPNRKFSSRNDSRDKHDNVGGKRPRNDTADYSDHRDNRQPNVGNRNKHDDMDCKRPRLEIDYNGDRNSARPKSQSPKRHRSASRSRSRDRSRAPSHLERPRPLHGQRNGYWDERRNERRDGQQNGQRNQRRDNSPEQSRERSRERCPSPRKRDGRRDAERNERRPSVSDQQRPPPIGSRSTFPRQDESSERPSRSPLPPTAPSVRDQERLIRLEEMKKSAADMDKARLARVQEQNKQEQQEILREEEYREMASKGSGAVHGFRAETFKAVQDNDSIEKSVRRNRAFLDRK